MNLHQILAMANLSIDAVIVGGTVYFVGKQATQALGLSNASESIKRHVADAHKLQQSQAQMRAHGLVGVNKGHLLTEQGVFELIQHSRKPVANKLRMIMDAAPKQTGLDFSDALRHLRAGAKITRAIWGSVKKYAHLFRPQFEGKNMGQPYLAIHTESGSNPTWVPRESDVLAGDWQVVQ